MAAEDYFDPYGDDENEQPSIVACKRCGKDGLHWENDDGQWNLYEGQYRLHKCNMQKAAADDFEAVE
jgi:hypothetical protein